MPDSAAGLAPLEGTFWQTLDDGLAAARLQLTEAQRLAFDRHIRLLVEWNGAINLTALRTPEQMARHHLLDSLIAGPTLESIAGQRATVVDIGSGAGFPGIPLGVFLQSGRVGLVESIAKKARFLEVAAREVADAVGPGAIDIAVFPTRAEELADGPDQRERWDVVTARAVGSVAEVAELGLPLARVEGHVAAWKFDPGDGSLEREVAAGGQICQAAGGGRPRIVPLPAASAVGLGGHCLVVIRKTRPTPDRYPRPPGERRRGAPARPRRSARRR